MFQESWTWVHFFTPNPIQSDLDVYNLHPIQATVPDLSALRFAARGDLVISRTTRQPGICV